MGSTSLGNSVSTAVDNPGDASGSTSIRVEPGEVDQPENGKATIRVILADTQAIFRAGLRKIFALEDDIRVVGQAESLDQTVAAIQRFSCDVVIFEAALSPNPADAVSGLIGAMIDRGEDRWGELGRALEAAKREPWFQVAKGSNSALGFMTALRLPLWAIRLYARWKLEPTNGKPFIDRLYDPAPTLASLSSTPSLWIFGGEDHSTPTAWSIAVLEPLRASGRPIQIKVFQRADHGILQFEVGPKGERRYLGYEPGYFHTEIDWLRRQSGLPVRAFTAEK